MSLNTTPLFTDPSLLYECRVRGDVESEGRCAMWCLARKHLTKCVQLILHNLSNEGEVLGPNSSVSSPEYTWSDLWPGFRGIF